MILNYLEKFGHFRLSGAFSAHLGRYGAVSISGFIQKYEIRNGIIGYLCRIFVGSNSQKTPEAA